MKEQSFHQNFLSQERFKTVFRSEFQKEKIAPIDAKEYVRRSLVTTKLLNAEVNNTNSPFDFEFRLQEDYNPVFKKGDKEVVLEGKHLFGQIINHADCEIVSVRLDSLAQTEIDSLLSILEQCGQIENSSIFFQKDTLNLSGFSQAVKNSIDSNNYSEQKQELVRQFEYVCNAQNAVHFGERAELPKYQLSDDNELVVFDKQINSYVRPKETTADPNIIKMLDEIGQKLASTSGPVSMSYTGTLSDRTRNKQPKDANPIVVSAFEKNQDGDISFQSDLPPDGAGLVQMLGSLGVEAQIAEQILEGKIDNQIIFKQQSGDLKQNKLYPGSNFSSTSFAFGGGSVLPQSSKKDQSAGFPMGAGGGFGSFYPVFKLSPTESEEDDEDEEEYRKLQITNYKWRTQTGKLKIKNDKLKMENTNKNSNIENTDKKTVDIKEKNNKIIQKTLTVKARKYRLGRNIYPKLRKYANTTRQKVKIPDNIINISDFVKAREKRQKISTAPNFLLQKVLVDREALTQAA